MFSYLLPLLALLSGIGAVGVFALASRLRHAPVAPSAPRRLHAPVPSPAIDRLLAAAAANPQEHGRHRLNEDLDTSIFAAIVPAVIPSPSPVPALEQTSQLHLVKTA